MPACCKMLPQVPAPLRTSTHLVWLLVGSCCPAFHGIHRKTPDKHCLAFLLFLNNKAWFHLIPNVDAFENQNPACFIHCWLLIDTRHALCWHFPWFQKQSFVQSDSHCWCPCNSSSGLRIVVFFVPRIYSSQPDIVFDISLVLRLESSVPSNSYWDGWARGWHYDDESGSPDTDHSQDAHAQNLNWWFPDQTTQKKTSVRRLCFWHSPCEMSDLARQTKDKLWNKNCPARVNLHICWRGNSFAGKQIRFETLQVKSQI